MSARDTLDALAHIDKWAARSGQPVPDTVHNPQAWTALADEAAARRDALPANVRERVNAVADTDVPPLR